MKQSLSKSETPFHVSVEPDVETFIVGPSYALLRRELGAFTGSLEPGIYKFKFRRGTEILEQLQEIPAATNAPVSIVPSRELQLETAVPRARSSRSMPKHVAAARDMSRQTQLHVGAGSSVYVFMRNDPEAPPRDPASGFTLHALDDTLIADLAQLAVRDDPAAPTCAAFNVELAPGAYRLRYSGDGEPVEQIVIACAGWQTQVFLLHDRPRSSSPSPPLASASILMCRDGFNPEDELLHLADAARVALTLDRERMPRALLTRLLNDKFDSPMLGIYAAHAIASSGAKDEMLGRVLDALEGLLPGHPDVVALRAASSTNLEIDHPPMLRSSWKALVAASVEGKVRFPPGSLASRIPPSLTPGTPWLIWEVNALLAAEGVEHDVTGDLAAIQSMIEQEPIATEDRPLHLDGWEGAVFSYLQRRTPGSGAMESLESTPVLMDERGIARAFGTTVQHVQTTVAGLAEKLKTLDVTKK
ncbi:MAG: hypothetical protein ACXW5U_00090 [Thermoanaerobaculia bacterium]